MEGSARPEYSALLNSQASRLNYEFLPRQGAKNPTRHFVGHWAAEITEVSAVEPSPIAQLWDKLPINSFLSSAIHVFSNNK